MTRPALLRALDGEVVRPSPIWIMRQAGRYLPEYRATRAEAGGFLDLCFSPDLATEVTLQPIRRFGFDAAILFSDILVAPLALGRRVWFVEGEGPRLDPLEGPEAVAALERDGAMTRLAPVFEAIDRIKTGLSREFETPTPLIGFAGAPWTLATYMIAGRSTPDQAPAIDFARAHPEAFDQLMSVLAETVAEFLIAQIDAGVDVVKIFDSWAGATPQDVRDRAVFRPLAQIVRTVKAARPAVPVMVFPRGLDDDLPAFDAAVGADALALGQTVDLGALWPRLSRAKAVQGNLDPTLMTGPPDGLDAPLRALAEATRGVPHVFNLGHGVTPDTRIDTMVALIERWRRMAAD